MLDLAPWLSPLDGENPSGESLRDDPRFHEIERLMQAGTAVVRDERNNPIDKTEVPVDWTQVLASAEALRSHGRDLRLLVIVTRALTNEQGPAGLAEGLTLIARTLETHWDTLHPELRPAATPRDGALRRINALLQIENHEDGLLGDLRRRTAFSIRGLGPVRGLDLEHGALDSRTALNEAKPGMDDKERAALVASHEQTVGRVRSACAALADQSPAERTSLVDGLRAAAEALEALEAALAARLGDQVTLPALKRTLGRMLAPLDRPSAAAVTPAAVSGDESGAEPAAAASGGNAAAAVPGRITTREEVVTCLDHIIEFYDRTEPASPVPFLARRMRRMVPMDFLELMEDLAPSGLKEFRSLAGLIDKGQSRTQGDKT